MHSTGESSLKTLSESRFSRFLVLCVLYVAQGIPFGFVTIALVAYIAEKGGSTKQVGDIVAISVLPWSFKWIWGLVIDRFGLPAMGHRRPWILLAQFFMALTIGLMIINADAMTNLAFLGVMVFVHNMFSSLQDVSTDALAVDILSEGERGKANGLMRGASYLGTSIGAVGIGWILSRYGFRPALVFQVLLLLLIMMFPLFFRERPGEKFLPWTKGSANQEKGIRQIRSTVEFLKELFKAFSIRTTLMAAGLTIWVNIGVGLLAAVSLVMLIQNYGWSKEEWQTIQGVYVVWVGLGASILGGFIADIFSPRKTIALCIFLLGISWIGFSFCRPWWHIKPFIITFTLWEQFLIAFFTVAVFALCMSVSWSVVAGTQFTAYMAMLNVSTAIGSKMAGWVEDLDYRVIYVIAGFVQLISLLFLAFINPKQSQQYFDFGNKHTDKSLQ
jgi:PAT family beta-lactamase induction signal transducer AmpG